jgi:RNase H-fold protein (predicted Holliday junction resolvase)
MFSSIEWRVIDERLTTVGISKNLSAQGISTKDQKAFIDAAAACEILNGALVSEEKLGLRVGQLIENI